MNLFGANWRTSVSGYLETVCIIVIALGALPSEVWSNPRVWIPAALILIAKTVKDSLTKDKNVTGGMVQQTSSGDFAKAGTQTLVDMTVKSTIASKEPVTPEQAKLANS